MDSIGLQLQAILSKESLKQIHTDIQNLQKLFDASPIRIKIDIDNVEFKRFANGIQQLSAEVGKSLNLDDKFTSIKNKMGETTSTIREYTNAQRQQIQVTSQLNAKTKELELVQTKEVDNYKQQRQEATKVSETIENQIKLLQTRITLLKQNYWTGDSTKVDNFSNKLDTSKIDPNNYKATLSNLKNEYQLLANIMQDSHRNNLSNLQKEIQLENQKNASSMQNWTRKLEVDAQIRKTESDRLKNQMMLNSQMDIETQKLQNQLTLYKQKMLGGEGLPGEIDIFANKHKGMFDETALNRIKENVQSLNVDTPDLQNNIKKLGVEFSSLKQQAAQSGNVMTRALENAFKFLRFYLVGGLLVGFISNIRKGVAAVVDLDKALTELNKVADISSEQLKSITDRSFEAGTAIGRTGKEVINATAEWVRAGYQIEEAFKLSQQSLLLTNIGDGINDVKEASSSLIAILKGFKMEARETAHAVDALNEVSNNFAIDTNNLTEILKRTSGTIAQTGTSYEQLLGLATGGFESLRNAEMVASGLNMISQRLRGMAEDGSAIEGLIPKIQDAFDKYTDGAVSVIDKQNGGLHSTYEILEQLSKVYPTLRDEAKAYLNEAIAGNRQNKVLVSVMENWKNVEASIKSATNSLGSAEKENEKYLNSIEGKVAQLNSATQRMWANTIDTNVIKFLVDVGTGIIKTVDAFGLLNSTIMITTVSMILFNKGFKAFIATKITPYIATVIAGMRGLSGVASASAVSIGGLTLSVQALTTTITFGLSILIPILISGIQYLSKAAERQMEVIRKLREDYDSLSQSLEDNEKKQQNVIDRIKELYDLRSNNTITDAEKAELTRLESINTELERQIKYEKALLLIKSTKLEEETLALSKTPSERSSIISPSGGGYGVKIEKLTIAEKIDEDLASVEKYKTAMEELKDARDKELISAEEYGKKLDALTKTRDMHVSSLELLISKLEEENKSYVGATIEGNAKKAANEALIKIIQEAIISVSGYAGEIAHLGKKARETAQNIFNLEQSISNSNKTIDDFQSSVKDLSSAFEQLNKGEKLSADNLLDLIQKYPQYASQLANLNKSKDAAITLTKILFEVEKQRTIQKLENDKKELQGELDKLKGIRDAYVALLKYFPKLSFDPEQKTDKFSELQSQIAGLNAAISVLQKTDISSFYKSNSKSNSSSVKEIYKPIIDAYYEIDIILERINQALAKNAALAEQAEGSNKIALLKQRADLYKEQEEALKRLNVEQKKELQLHKASLSSMGFNFDSENNITNYANRLKQLTGDTAKSAEEVIKRFVELSTKAIPDTTIEILKLNKSIKDIDVQVQGYLTDTFGEFYNFLFHNIEKEIELLEESKKAAQEAAKEKIKGYEEEIARLTEKNDKQKEEEDRTKRLLDLAKQRDKLNNVQSERNVKMLQADGSFGWVADPRKVREETEKLQDLQDGYYSWEEDIRQKKEIQTLRDQISAINTELKNEEEKYDNQIKSLNKFIKDQKDLLSGANNFQIKNANDLKKALEGIDSELYAGRLEALTNFINTYNQLTGQLNIGSAPIPSVSIPKTSTTATTTAPTTTTSPITGSVTTSPVSGSSGSTSTYSGNSIVDYLKSIGADSSFENRRVLSGLGDLYKGTADQNKALLVKLRGYEGGGINDTPGLAMLHGTKSRPEAIFNTQQLNSLFKLLENPFQLRTSLFNAPNVAMAGNLGGGGVTNVYHLNVGEVKTNDAQGLINNFKNLVSKK